MKHLRTMKFSPSVFCALALTFLSSPTLLAQGAESILSKLSSEAKAYGSIEATYVSHMVDKVSDFEAKQEGKIFIDGEKYFLDLGDYTIICDGITIWTYETSVNDCYVDDADAMAEEGMDPSKLFTLWEDDFKNELKEPTEIGNRTVTHVNLYPNQGEEKPFHTIQLFIDEAKMEMVRDVVKGREGTDVTYDVTSFRPRAQVSAEKFTFDANAFPGVTIIDNRL